MSAGRPRLPRVTVASQVRDFLVLEIAQGRLNPGDPIRELEIAERLGTSQTPVREALRALAALGLIESRPHIGTRVRDIADQDLIDAVPVRSALEGIAGRCAAGASIEDIDAIREAFDRMAELAPSGDRLEFAAASTAFHRAIVHAAHNESLTRAWNSLGIEVMTIMAMASSEIALSDAAESHREVLEAIIGRDPERAEASLREHVAGYIPIAFSREADDELLS
jgi:DNA-binding GntR family transcriptional regulator